MINDTCKTCVHPCKQVAKSVNCPRYLEKIKPLDIGKKRGWNKSLPLATHGQAVQHINDLQKRGYEVKGPRRADGKRQQPKCGENCDWVVLYRPRKNTG